METDKKMGNDFIRNYMRYLKLERSYSLNTLEAYRHDLQFLIEYGEKNDKSLLEMKLEDLETFSASLHDKKIGARSQARILSGVRSFYRFLVLDGYIKDDPTELLPSPQIGQHLPEYLSVEEVDALEGAIDLSKWEGQRNKAIIETLFSCGLRVSELVNLKKSEVFEEEKFIRVLGKGSKERLVPISGKALKEIKILGEMYGLELGRPAQTAQEAVQWVYMAYLAAVKEQDGAAMSLGNVSSFIDIYVEHDLKHGLIDETFAQELIDQFVIKLRMVRHLRMAAYNEIFAGDPTWVTESLGGRFNDGRTKVTKTSFRFLQTLYNLGPSPEPNLTVLWSPELPEGFKNFCAKVSIDTSSIQYENDTLMREVRHSDDYGIACCVSFQDIGRQIQFFGARCNLAKALLLALNGGRCEKTGTLMVEGIPALTSDTLNFEEVMKNYKLVLTQIARVYNEAMNIIHYMHDKYYYEKAQMAFVDTDPRINIAYGAAGLSIALDSLSAIKYAKVTARRNAEGLTEGFDIDGEFPCFGNNDDRVDHLGVDLVYFFTEELKKLPVYKNARPTLSLLTITSNVMYGKKTGATPDGREAGVAFAPGANPMHGRDKSGAVASLASVAKLRYRDSQDGISNTFSIVPKSLGPTPEERIDNLVTMMDGYFTKGAHHLNVNALNREMLEDAMEHPENYPQLTIRVSGYAVNFVKLSREHQLEVISRTFHERM